jgi:hypothetical protein
MAANPQHTSISGALPAGIIPDNTSNAPTRIQSRIAGRKNIQCALVEYSTFSPGCRFSSI